jgi:hypothetical protein
MMRQDDKHNLMWMAGFILLVLGSVTLFGAIMVGGQYAVERLGLNKKTQCVP